MNNEFDEVIFNLFIIKFAFDFDLMPLNEKQYEYLVNGKWFLKMKNAFPENEKCKIIEYTTWDMNWKILETSNYIAE